MFLPGLELSRAFHAEVVGPLLDRLVPGTPLTVARIGPGSEVLGFDTERSADHEWGPRLEVFLPDGDGGRAAGLVAALAHELPRSFRGFSTHFAVAGDDGIGVMAPTEGAVAHRVAVTSLAEWCHDRLGGVPHTPADWLAVPAQRLAEATAGAVFRDDTGALTALRARLRWYPPDVWRHLLAGQWARIAEEAAFPGRCAEVGDELGSALVTARLARELVVLRLLLHRSYPPYAKWLGSAHAALPDPHGVGAALRGAVTAAAWPEREAALCRAYRGVLTEQNARGLAAPVDPEPRRYYDRPFLVPAADAAAAALVAAITDPAVRALPPAVDQLTDSTPVLTDAGRCRALVLAVTD